MKKLTKYLALLLAGLVTAASLAACLAVEVNEDADDGDKEEEETDQFDVYRKLSPAEAIEALKDAEEVSLSFKISDSEDGETEHDMLVVERDGDKLKFTAVQEFDGDREEETNYADLSARKAYYEDDGEWDIEDLEDDMTWTSLLEELSEAWIEVEGLSILAVDDNYDKNGAVYTIKDSVWEELLAENGLGADADEADEVVPSASMTRDGTTYTFLAKVNRPESESVWEYTIEFDEMTVELPEGVSDGESGDSSNETTAPSATDAPVNTDAPIIATTAPIETLPPETVTPDVTTELEQLPPETVAPETVAPDQPQQTLPPVTTTNTPPATDAPVVTDAPATNAPPVTDAPTATLPPVEQPTTPASPYSNMKPSGIYTALANAEDVGIAVIAEGTFVVYEKDGDKLSVYTGTNETDGETVYIDMANNNSYVEVDGEWYQSPPATTITWESLLQTMQLSANTYAFVDGNYNAFSASDSQLTIKSSVLTGSDVTASGLERNGLNYYLTETYADGTVMVTVFSFEEMTVEFPATVN